MPSTAPSAHMAFRREVSTIDSGRWLNAYDLIGYQTMYKKTAEYRLHIRKIRSELMQQPVRGCKPAWQIMACSLAAA